MPVNCKSHKLSDRLLLLICVHIPQATVRDLFRKFNTKP